MKTENKSKKVKFSYTVNKKHWFGDGFNVHGPFVMNTRAEISQAIKD